MPKKPDTTDAPEALVTIELAGQIFTFPRDQDEWPTGAIVAAGRVTSGRSQYDEVVECLLGEEQWDRLKLLPFRQFKEFLGLFSASMDDVNGGS
jgi:hypothetical protein